MQYTMRFLRQCGNFVRMCAEVGGSGDGEAIGNYDGHEPDRDILGQAAAQRNWLRDTLEESRRYQAR